MIKPSAFTRACAAALALSLVAAGCGSDSDGAADAPTSTEAGTGAEAELTLSDDDALAVATTYADVVFAAYDDNVEAATELQALVAEFVAAPTQEGLDAARAQWLAARDLYGPTEVFRFYDGPIDDPDTGPEGQINAWPLDEAYLDYVEDDPEAGIVNDTAGVPEITTDVLVEANEAGGETNISTGWHAIEFLLWGQDVSEDGPGDRPVTDYTTAANADRRGTYLTLLTDLLVSDLTSVRDQWDPEQGSFRETFLAEPGQAVADILRGMGALSAGELAGERMAVPYETKDAEDEHSCFSDNTLADIVNNAKGIELAYTAVYDGVDGTSLSDVVAEADPDLDADLRERLAANVAAAEALPGPFDQLIAGDDEDEDRAALLALIESLQAQGDAIAELAAALGYEISIEI
jgi:putative iron-regulated protein